MERGTNNDIWCVAAGTVLFALLASCGGSGSRGGGGPAASNYTIGGSVSGLSADASVVLLDNGADALTVSANGTFTFAAAIATGAAYAVTVSKAPNGETCAVNHGSGTMSLTNVTNVSVVCTTTVAATHTIGGNISGLSSGASVVLLDNGADALTVKANGAFTFAAAIATGSTYAVTVGTSPSGEACSVSNSSGTVGSADIATVSVTCTATASVTYTIGGSVTGLSSGATLILLDNGGDALTVTANGIFTFRMSVVSGAAYAVTVSTAPSGATCTVSNGSGAARANVTNVTVRCVPAVASTTLFYSFGPNTGTDGIGPNSLIVARDGNFYGTTANGGTTGTGTVFRISPTGIESIVYSFGTSTALIGYIPSSLRQGTDGNFYGITNSGGTYGEGIAFQVTPAGAETVLHSFGSLDSFGALDGRYPNSLIQAVDGDFYGTTETGNADPGIVFQVTAAGVEKVFYGFTASAGAGPLGIIQGSDGNFYGAAGGGANNTGVIYKITPGGTQSVLYSFGPSSGNDGQNPAGGLVEASDGNFYGLTSHGGANGTGTVFKVTPAGVETILYSFDAPTSGVNPTPRGALIQGNDGNLYGCTQHSGTLNIGTVFKLTPAGVHSIVHSFAAGSTDAAEPGVLLQIASGDIYGAAMSGGAHASGAIFKITP
jgi:uncharacterized repeat protein (TIGR03803 family)